MGAEHHVDPGRAGDHGVAVLLREAAADGDLQAGVLALRGAELAECAVEAFVGVLADGAGVEDDEVGLLIDGGLVPGLLEEPGESLGIVDVHLAPEGAHFIGAGGIGLKLCHGTSLYRRRVSGPKRRPPHQRHINATTTPQQPRP